MHRLIRQSLSLAMKRQNQINLVTKFGSRRILSVGL